MYNPFGISFAHDTIFVADVLGMVWLWSKDGLYLGRLLNDAEPGRPWDAYAMHAEIQGPVTLVTNDAGQLLMIVNDTGAHVYEVTLPTLETLPATSVEVTPAMAAAALRWDPDGPIPVAGSILEMRTSTNNVLISWHTNAAALALQSALTVTGAWNNVTGARQTNAELFTVTIPRSAVRRFYRLTK